jgi:hypothetical protein
MKRNCGTRWIERFHAVTGSQDFKELYNHVIGSFETIYQLVNNETSGRSLRNVVLDLEFLIFLFVLNKGFSVRLPLSVITKSK